MPIIGLSRPVNSYEREGAYGKRPIVSEQNSKKQKRKFYKIS